jgi:hypothetical protein
MFDNASGEYVRGFLASDDMTTAVEVPLFNKQGVARVIAAGERLVIGQLIVNNGATVATFTVFSDATADGIVDTGETLFAGIAPVNGSLDANPLFPLIGIRSATIGVKTKIKASVASVGARVTLVGMVVKT